MNRKTAVHAVVALVLLLVAAPLAAQDAQSTPERLAGRVNQITAAHDWNALVDIMDPTDLERVQRTFIRLFELDPDPQAFGMFGVNDLAGFRALTPQQIMVKFLEIAELQQQLQAMEFIDGRVLGVVRESEDEAHAVVRQTVRMMGMELSAADVISMRQRQGRWWVQMGPELEGMLIGIEAGLAASQ